MKLIVACDPKGGIGYNNKLPWSNIQGDLPRFKNLTQGQIIVMGRNTWDSLPKKPLPNRFNVVVTSKSIDNTTTINVGIPMAGRTGLIKKIKNITNAEIKATSDTIMPISIIILAGILVVEIKPLRP